MDETYKSNDEPIPHRVELGQRPRREYVKDVANLLLRIKELEEVVYKDQLTGLSNRRALDENLPTLLETARSTNTPLAVLRMDVDGLKKTNDKLGHVKGDDLLRIVGPVLESIVRPGDMVGRDGGDEFFALMPGFEPLPGQNHEKFIADVKSRIRQKFVEKAQEAGIPDEYNVGLSVGIAMLEDDDTPESLLNNADEDLLKEKRAFKAALEAQGVDTYDERLGAA